MDTISTSFSDWVAQQGSTEIDTVVIGSGYGGAVAALRLAQTGSSVVVLERGSEFLAGDFPNEFGHFTKFQRVEGPEGPMGRPSGLFNWRLGSGFAALVANGVGGGSLINAGVAMRPEDEVFSQAAWPAAIRYSSDPRPEFTLEAAFAKAEATLRVNGIIRSSGAVPRFAKSKAIERLGDALRSPTQTVKIQAAALTIDPAKCTACGDCFSGCNVEGAKLTLRDTYLVDASAAGAVIVAGATVWTLAPAGAAGWDLRCIATEKITYRSSMEDAVRIDGVTIRARNVIVSAGTFGSTELLQRSKHRFGELFQLSPALGTRLSGNGDSLSASVDERKRVDAFGHGSRTTSDLPEVGPTITTVLDLRDGQDLRKRVVIQEGAVPGALAVAVQELLATTWSLTHIGAKWQVPRSSVGADPLGAPTELARRSQVLLTMGHDSANGRIVFMPGMDASVPYWVAPEDEVTYKHQAELLKRASKAVGGTHMFSPLWQLLPPSTARALGQRLLPPTTLTVHPLGGCPMGDDFDTGVVNDRGQVFSRRGSVYETLTILDGSVIPTSLGCNPLLTITAIAERALAYMTEGKKARGPGPAQPTGSRHPMAPVREHATAYEVVLSERLTAVAMNSGGRLQSAFGEAPVAMALEMSMHTPDWEGLWRGGQHVFDDVRGNLVLQAEGTDRGATYRITRGTVELFGRQSRSFVGSSTLASALTWLILRGARDISETVRKDGPSLAWLQNLPSLVAMLSQAGRDKRFVRYRLDLDLTHHKGVAPPRRLTLTAYKDIRYAATWGAICGYVLDRFLLGKKRAPADLRRTYAEQVTEPLVQLIEPGWRTKLVDHGLIGLALLRAPSTRLRFDARFALARSPATLVAGGDSGSFLPVLAAYPALVLRHALQTRLLDFRLPTYSHKEVVDRIGKPLLRADRCHSNADVPPVLDFVRVRRGRSTADDGTEPVANLSLPLWRYQRTDARGEPTTPHIEEGRWHGVPVRRAKSVLLMHAFGMSGSTFTLPEVTVNLAEYLYSKGYEIWIFDTRMSPRVGGSMLQSTLDQVGLIDTPAAVDRILEELGGTPAGAPPLQIFSFAHCMGAGAMLVGLLGGKLSYGEHTFDGGRRHLPKLAALVSSQVHPFMVGSNSSLSKTWFATFARDVFRRLHIPLAMRAAVPPLAEQLLDRIFAALPVPEGEGCHDEGTLLRRSDDDCATCRRIRFLDGELFKHRNLNKGTHEALPLLFGPANIRLFAHAGKVVDYERLVSEDGLNAYVTDEAMLRYLSLPLRFVHGELNELFSSESAVRSSAQFKRINPELSSQFGANATGLCHHIVPGYGHLDLLIGHDLHLGREGQPPVYEQLTSLFDLVWANSNHHSPRVEKPLASVADVRMPVAGPWVSPVFLDGDLRKVRVAFAVDDFTDRASGTSTTLNAAAIVHHGSGGRSVIPLKVFPYTAPLAARDGFLLPNHQHSLSAPVTVHIAAGILPAPPVGRPLRAELITYSDFRTLGDHVAMRRARRPHKDGFATPAGSKEKAYTRLSPVPDEGALHAAIRKTRDRITDGKIDGQSPFPKTLSATRRRPMAAATRWLHVRSGVLDSPGPYEEVRLAVGSCRYPGLPFDRTRADETFARMVRLGRVSSRDRPHVALMLGDQIYADSTAHIADPISAVERFHRKHIQAFTTPWLRRLLAMTPTVMTPDDHEYTDNYPSAAPLFPNNSSDKGYAALREFALHSAASDAIKAFQFATYGKTATEDGCTTFSIGDVRVLVADTRTYRRKEIADLVTLSARQRAVIAKWVADSTPTSFQVLCSGSVVLPSIVRGADPSNAGKADSWCIAAKDQQWLLELLTRQIAGRFALVSGDYHVSACAEIVCDGAAAGVAVVAPPFYAPLPYANAQPSDLVDPEETKLSSTTVTSRLIGSGATGSGYGLLRVVRDETTGSWRVRYEVDIDPLDGSGWSGLHEFATWPRTAGFATTDSSPRDAHAEHVGAVNSVG